MTMLIDSHVHLNDDKLYADLDKVISASHDAGIGGFVCIGYDLVHNERALSIAKAYPQVYAAIGFHPSEAMTVSEADFAWLENHLDDPKVVAIGEIGLDYHWDRSFMDTQVEVFIRQLKLANRRKLPIVVHMRDATADCLEILSKYKDPDIGGVMHCYSGSVETMGDFIKLNMKISLAGTVTFKNAKTPKAVAHDIGLDDLLIETDAPYLAPEPYRGKMNEPKYLVKTAEAVATIRDVPFSVIAEATSKNTIKLFGIDPKVFTDGR